MFKGKRLVFIVGVLLLVLLGVPYGYAVYTTPPEILTTSVELEFGEEFSLDEIETSDDVVSKEVVEGKIDTKQVGKQQVTIEVTNKRDISATGELEVTVVDNEAPVIKVEDEFTVEAGEKFDIKEHVKVTDNADGDLKEKLTVSEYKTDVVSEHEVNLSVVDSSDNKAEKTVKLNVVDTTKPVISAKNRTLTEGESINLKEGVTAKDNIDGDLTDKIEVSGEVNTKKPGEYKVTYKVEDKSGNKASATIVVTVKKKPEPPKAPVNNTQSSKATNNNGSSKSSSGGSSSNQAPAKSNYAPMTVYFNGKAVPYKNGGMKNGQAVIDSHGGNKYASTWGGAEVFSGTDGLNTHIIGHNPGPFNGIWNAKEITVTDANGTPYTYVVTNVYKLADGSFTVGAYDRYDGWHGVVNPYKGEMITVQTCVANSGNMNYIIEAKLK